MNLKNYSIGIIPELKIVLHLKKVFVCPNCKSRRERKIDSVLSFCGCGFNRELSEEEDFEVIKLVPIKSKNYQQIAYKNKYSETRWKERLKR